jgi:putative ABC transport system permease protein
MEVETGTGTAAAGRGDGDGAGARFARRFPAVVLAWRNLRRNRLRSGLAALGICIGVFAVVTLGVFGTALQLSATAELGGLGDQVIVSPAAEAEGDDVLTPRQLAAVERAAAGRGTVVPLYTDEGVARVGGERTFVQVYGTNRPAALFDGREGALPARHRGGAIVGPAVAAELDLRVGSTVELDGEQYRVVAITAEGEDVTPIRPDNAVVLSERPFAGGYDRAVVVADSPGAAAAVADEVRRTVNVRVRRVEVFELSSVLDAIAEFFTLLNRFLIGLGAVSLFVAGVSILNVMLMSTAERRGEIGVMRAVGIHRGDVLRMLLVEAALLGAVGGVAGAALSVVAAAGLWAFTPIGIEALAAPRNAGYVVGGFAFGVIVALASGLYPAWRAAGERPVEALRG